MGNRFGAKLGEILDGVAPEVRDECAHGIELVRRAGVDSYENLLAMARDGSTDVNTRIAAIWLLRWFRGPRAQDTLLSALYDPHPDVAREAGVSLAVCGTRRTVHPLIDAMLAAEQAEARAAAAYALGCIPNTGRREIEPLLQVVQNKDEHPRVRAQAAESLQCSCEPRAVGILIEALRDPSAEVRFWAAFALGELGGPGTPGASEAVPELERLAATDREAVPGWWSVSKEAADALDRLRTRTAP